MGAEYCCLVLTLFRPSSQPWLFFCVFLTVYSVPARRAKCTRGTQVTITLQTSIFVPSCVHASPPPQPLSLSHFLVDVCVCVSGSSYSLPSSLGLIFVLLLSSLSSAEEFLPTPTTCGCRCLSCLRRTFWILFSTATHPSPSLPSPKAPGGPRGSTG